MITISYFLAQQRFKTQKNQSNNIVLITPKSNILNIFCVGFDLNFVRFYISTTTALYTIKKRNMGMRIKIKILIIYYKSQISKVILFLLKFRVKFKLTHIKYDSGNKQYNYILFLFNYHVCSIWDIYRVIIMFPNISLTDFVCRRICRTAQLALNTKN